MNSRIRFRSLVALCAVALGTSFWMGAFAQTGGYHVGESTPQVDKGTPPTTPPPSNQDAGPVRMARVSYVNGNVTWRPDGDTDWTSATVNTPLRQGAQIWVGDGGRVELQFDDGSDLRLGSGGVATLQTLFSDSQGEFTEIKMTDGLGSLDLRTDHSIFQIDTPHGSVKSVGPSQVRVGVDEDVEVGVREGSATLDGPQGKLTMHSGDYVDVQNDSTAYQVQALPEADSWDKFVAERHTEMAQVDKSLPENMQYMAGGDIDKYGKWRNDSQYGEVWQPDEPSNWQPYQAGQWVWVDPFGWTWVGSEPWGWVPYHYGAWVRRDWGWGWVPGPVCQYWSPGVVSFSYSDDNVYWAPLAPSECLYPSAFSVGFFGVGWGAWFSIGCCGCWYPYGGHSCACSSWNNHWVNHWHGWGNGVGHGWDHGQANHLGGGAWSNSHFTPSNARFGSVSASTKGFGGHGAYTAMRGNEGLNAFTRGKVVGAPEGRGGQPLAGPVRVAQPGANSWSATRSATTRPEENTGIINRPTYQGSSRTGLTRTTNPAPLGERYSSASEAAAAARRSLGWTPRGGGSSFGGSNSEHTYNRGDFRNPSSSRGQSGSGGFGGGGGRSATGLSQQRHGWSVPDHSGWTHVHSSWQGGHGFGGSFGGGGRSFGGGGSSGGSRGGGGGGGGHGH